MGEKFSDRECVGNFMLLNVSSESDRKRLAGCFVDDALKLQGTRLIKLETVAAFHDAKIQEF